MQLKMLVPDAAVLGSSLTQGSPQGPRSALWLWGLSLSRQWKTRTFDCWKLGVTQTTSCLATAMDSIMPIAPNKRNLLTRADGRDCGWQQRRGPARVQRTGQPWLVSTQPSACQLGLGPRERVSGPCCPRMESGLCPGLCPLPPPYSQVQQALKYLLNE